MSKMRVYLGDWSLNLGIMGFMTILDFAKEFNPKFDYTKKANYLEFDSDILKDFPKYYFDFFLKKYDKKESLLKSINYSKGSYTKEFISLNECNTAIRKAIMYEATKLSAKGTNFNNDAFLELEAITSRMSKMSNYTLEDLDVEIDKCIAILGSDRINERLTLNVIRNAFGSGGVYFGQASYLQKNGSKLTAKESADKVYKDYIYQLDTIDSLRGIVETGIIADIEKFVHVTLEDLATKSKYSSTRIANISSMLKAIKKVLTPTKKGLPSEDVLLGKINDILTPKCICSVCNENANLYSDVTESVFAPIMLSSGNSLNFHWNLEVNSKVCDLCRLMYLCADAGSVKEGEKYVFVNMSSSIKDLYNANKQYKNISTNDSSFAELLSYLVDTDIQKSKWRLQNIQIIEYYTNMDSNKSRVGYYSIPPYLAKFLVSTDVSVLKDIKNSKLKLKVLKTLLSNRDIKDIILEEMFTMVKNNPSNADVYFDLERLIKLRYIISKYRRGRVSSMNTKEIIKCKMCGITIRDRYLETGSRSRLTTIIYGLLNNIKTGNKRDFSNTLFRLFNNCGMDIPNVISIPLSNGTGVDFDDMANAFVSGLIGGNSKKDANVSSTEDVVDSVYNDER